MGLERLGINLAKKCAAYTKACGKSSILETKPIHISNVFNAKELKYSTKDTLSLSETSCFVKRLFENHETKSIKILIDGEKVPFTQFVDSQKGSNPAFWALNNNTRELYYMKFPGICSDSVRHLESEVVASKLYNLAGIETPKVQLAKLGDFEYCMMSKFVEGLKSPEKPAVLKDGFAADAWLANWDSLLNGNTMVRNGKIIKIDNGGALNYRAQGKLKPNFGDKVEELVSLTNGHNYISTAVYGKMSHQELLNSFKKVTAISDESIKSVVQDGEIAEILINRRNYLQQVLTEMEKHPNDGESLSNYFRAIDSIIKTPEKEYSRITKNMIAQRANMTNPIEEGVTVEQQLRGYKDNYIGLNREIRNKIRESLGEEDLGFLGENCLQAETSLMDKLICQGYLPEKAVLYRGATPFDFGLADMSGSEFIQKFYKKGKIFQIPIYPETSLDKAIGEGFACEGGLLFKINAPKGTPAIYMEKLQVPKSGGYGNEEEVLLARDLMYKFKSLTQENGHYIVELDVVTNKPFWKKLHKFWEEMM